MASPRVMNVMLAVHEKKTAAVDIYHPLRQYIATTFSEPDAQANEDDLQAVNQMRSNLQNPSSGAPSPELRRDLLHNYFHALGFIEPRFPISRDRSHVHFLVFTWHDVFKPNTKVSLHSIHLEKAAVLFNLAAVYSQIALSADRSSPTGLKQACNSFQAAARSFAFLRDQAAAKAVAAGATLDLSPQCSSMLERLMLAQAQECFFEKVIADAYSPGLCSKVARQVGLYYEEAYAAITSPPLNKHFDRTWASHVQLKAAQFYAEACYRYSLELHEKGEIGEEIGWLKIGLGAFTDAKKSTKGVAQPLIDAVSSLKSNMNRNLERATKENDRVYCMRVPAPGSLSALPGVSLVKPTPMGEISKYTEMVDDIIRTQAEKLQQGSEITRVKLKEMDLPDSILALEGNFSLPMDLKEDVEAVQISGGPSGLEAELQQIRYFRRVTKKYLVQTEELLQKKVNEDTQIRTQFGRRWTIPRSSTLTENLQDGLNRFAANLKQATESDTQIERAVNDNAARMAILDRRPIESALPSLARPIMSLDGIEDAIVGALKQSLRQLETLGSQRAGLEDMLKDMKRKNDILPKLMASTGSHEDLFKMEIAKYDPICEEIAQNIKAQEQLLLQIQAQNNEFASVFNLEDYKVAREKCYKQISAAIAKYREIKRNITEELEFYSTLWDAIANFKRNWSLVVMTINIQCHHFVMTTNVHFWKMFGMKKVVLKLDLHDYMAKMRAMKAVYSLYDKKLTVIGAIDPGDMVGKLRKFWHTEILSIQPVQLAIEEKKKEEPKEEKKGKPKDKKKIDVKKVVLKVDLDDDEAKKRAMKAVYRLHGVDFLSMDMKDKKLTVIGAIDPVDVVGKLRKFWHTKILPVQLAKEEKKKEEPKKDKKKIDVKLQFCCWHHQLFMGPFSLPLCFLVLFFLTFDLFSWNQKSISRRLW